jgi:cyclopropane-fatty-acyl-phospholipid synthase
METGHGISGKIASDSTTACSVQAVWGWANPIWKAGGSAKTLQNFFRRIIPSDPETKLKKNWKRLLYFFQTAVLNPGRKAKAYEIGEKHYDVGNDLYRQMLDKRIVYSCGYWKGAKNVDEAQEAKLDLICRKLGLKPGEKVLDIGCGWGSFAKYAAEKCGADVVEITSLRNNRPWLGNFARDCPSR